MPTGRWRASLGMALSLCLAADAATALLLDFDEPGLMHGTVVDDQFLTDFGVRFSAVNDGGGPDLAVLFDSSLTGTSDMDLEFPIASGLFNMLIIQENADGCREFGLDDPCDDPDDEGSRPAGSITLDFVDAITQFGFDLMDVEGPLQEMGQVVFLAGDDVRLVRTFGSFIASDGAVYGDNTANTIAPIDLTGFGDVDRVIFELGGSSAVDNLRYELVPEPGTAALVALGLTGLGWSGRTRLSGGREGGRRSTRR